MNHLSRLFVLLSLVSVPVMTRDANADPIKIGVLLCQTGSCAEWGTAAREGVQLAAEELNARGGIAGRPVELVLEDSAEDTPSRSLTGYRNLRSRGVNLIIGPTWSAAAQAISPVAKLETDVLMISPSVGVRDFNEAGDNLFNVWPHDEFGARKLAQFAREQGILKVALFSVQQTWSETQAKVFREEFETRGGIISAEVSPAPDTRDLRTEAGRIIRSKADAVVFTCFSEQMGIAATQLSQLGFHGPKLSVLMYETAIGAARGTLEGAIYTSFPEPTSSFRHSFMARFGRAPATSADKGYDAMHLLAQAIERSPNSSVMELTRVLASTQDFFGASGKISFTAKRAVSRYPEVFQVSSGKMGLAYTAGPGQIGNNPVLALRENSH